MATVTLELGVERIDAAAFADAQALEEIWIPHSLRRVGWGAFGRGRREEKLRLLVENEYMLRRMKRLLFWAGGRRAAEVVLAGKTLEERKRERRRQTLEQTPAHLLPEVKTFIK